MNILILWHCLMCISRLFQSLTPHTDTQKLFRVVLTLGNLNFSYSLRFGMNVMLWYKQLHDGQMKLIVYSYTVGHPAFEKDFKKRFAMRRTDIQTGALIISNVEPNDSATYFCAAKHSNRAMAMLFQ
uniref:Immunoglobulin V-set domain-containing protein n=1 Tax=Periophthalmus magnuspinnatus TaxID=409849 RepID=A0A3B4AUG1_9GOBI